MFGRKGLRWHWHWVWVYRMYFCNTLNILPHSNKHTITFMCKEAIGTALTPPLEFASAADFSRHWAPVRQKNKEQMLAERQLLPFSLLPNGTCKSLQHLSAQKTTLAPCPALLCDKQVNAILFIFHLGVEQGSGAWGHLWVPQTRKDWHSIMFWDYVTHVVKGLLGKLRQQACICNTPPSLAKGAVNPFKQTQQQKQLRELLQFRATWGEHTNWRTSCPEAPESSCWISRERSA